MSDTIRVIVVNTDEEAKPELRHHLLCIPGVKIVAEVDEALFLPQALAQFPCEVLLVHLDPAPAAIMDVVAPLLEAHKDEFVAIGMTEDRDAELVMRAMRAGMRELLWKPFPPEQLTEIMGRARANSPKTAQRVGKLVPVVSANGGAGATTVATNLSVELAQLDNWAGQPNPGKKPKVAVVDLDFRYGQVSMFLDAQPTHTIADLCESPEHLEPALIDRAMFKHPTGVHVLAHPPDIEQAERITAANCAGALAALQENYDFVIVDGPVRFDHTARAVFDMTDVYLLVLQLLVPSVRSADRYLNELKRCGYNLDRIRMVCNRVGREVAYLEPTDVEATLKRKLNWHLPDEWKFAATSVNVGQSLFEFAPKSKLRLAYRQIALDIAGVGGDSNFQADASDAPAKAETPKKGGFFSIFNKG
ncbi:MAG: hypothetical protein SF069_08215 [Phycisphaerae bacterium]|nr:hypothetical protein [Phycisphaerae bacterium]